MSFNFTEFTIEGLHGYRDISIPISDNKIVMVGVNGLGKTTVINLLYYTLSRQWDKMLEYDFRSLSFTIDGTKYQLSRTELEPTKKEALREVEWVNTP